MNVTCDGCRTTYRVDPAKVPPAGVRARCSVCDAVFWVRLAPADDARQPAGIGAGHMTAPAAAPTAAAPMRAPEPPVAPTPIESWPAAAPDVPLAVPTLRMPVTQAPPAAPVSAPPMSAPAMPAFESAAPAPRPPAVPGRPAGRPVNPFLSQDPAQKARRLARALVSDMVAYHPAKRADGIRNGTLRELFDEEIKKSWEEFSDQVGREVAEGTPYFREALNEILADGRQVF